MSLPYRKKGFPDDLGLPSSVFRSAEHLKAHPAYKAAKSGDVAAAAHLVMDLVPREYLQDIRRRYGSDVTFVPVLARELNGHNHIPGALARYLANATGGEVLLDIVQANSPHHTGADSAERLAARPLFDGPVEPGRRYVLVDDISTTFSTLAELADHIQAWGGRIAGAAVLANASRSGRLCADPQIAAKIERRYGDAIREELGIEPGALTFDEAQYIIGFRTAEEFRNRIDSARRETSRRLLSKNLQARFGIKPAQATEPRPVLKAEHGISFGL